MKFFQFLEAKFTEHSLGAQEEKPFSILNDGEQKATQVYMKGARLFAKYWACIKLPLHWMACKIGLVKWPKSAFQAVEEFTEQRKLLAEKERERLIEEKKNAPPQPADGPDNPNKVAQLKPQKKS